MYFYILYFLVLYYIFLCFMHHIFSTALMLNLETHLWDCKYMDLSTKQVCVPLYV